MGWSANEEITEIRAPLEKDVEPTMVVGSDTATRHSTLKKDRQTDRIFEAGEKKLCHSCSTWGVPLHHYEEDTWSHYLHYRCFEVHMYTGLQEIQN
jgi:ribonucleotide monophosphatase NagD (HAD superfamily)